MAGDRKEPLARTTVIKLAAVLGLEDNAFIIGGQALNLWAERYAPQREELIAFGPFTSKDLDYFGHREAAKKLASALKGKVHYPGPDDHTPNSAVVTATIDGIDLEIDFLSNVMGVRANALERNAVELIVPVNGDGVDELALPVMHPLHCLQSRVANVVNLGRQDDVALRQLAAAPIVLEAYVDEMLAAGEVKEAKAVFQHLFQFLRSDIAGRQCPDLPMRNPAEVLATFQRDRRIDWRFRWFNLRSMRRKLRRRKRGQTEQ
ncbi:hypothetical protein GGQ88_003824 [Novosphingobium hassiacum]|uniref:Nucleotidyl transferase AbiEii/AbiGii toxin family protein n=1 Tax=Novosphingobium hassiacum TaxID=173676 RepID=A0A7W5ZYS1_9SPHN|nr:hypothetical protein [Novosphingobium hassiacum]MBB3862523.1 hypothetical protein [Novosphingobium hassiacum]